MEGTPNPICACGCGYEVALPWNKFIQGHANAIRLTDAARAELNKMLQDGESSYKIAAKFGRSQAQVVNWKWSGVPVQKPAERILRREVIEKLAALKQVRSELLADGAHPINGTFRKRLKSIQLGRIPQPPRKAPTLR